MSQLKKVLAPAANKTAGWYVKVPILTNPFIALDFVTAVLAVLAGTFCLVSAVQFVTGGGIGPQQVEAALHVALYVAAGLAVALVFISLVCLKNRYVVYYELTDASVMSELLNDAAVGRLKDYARTKAVECGAPESSRRSRSRTLFFKSVKHVREFSGQRVLQVKGEGVSFKVYCVTRERYAAVLAALRQEMTP